MNSEKSIETVCAEAAETLKGEIEKVSVRATIWHCIANALQAHIGKPIGKRLCATLEDELKRNNIVFRSVFIGGSKDWRNLTVYIGPDYLEQKSFEWDAKTVSKEIQQKARELNESIFKHYSDLIANQNGLIERAKEFALICQQFAQAKAALESIVGVPFVVRNHIQESFGIR